MQSSSSRIVVGSIDALRSEFAERVTRLAAWSMAERVRFSMAIPGGSLTTTLLPGLVDAPIDWSRVDIFWCDERAVPFDDPLSNFGGAVAGWLGSPALRLARLHPMPGGTADVRVAAEAYADEMLQTLGAQAAFDLAVLGVGEDGHVASLFPGHGALDERRRWVTVETDAPKPPPRRITLTLPIFEQARTICVAAFGAAKREVMRRALDDDGCDLPVARVLRRASSAWVLLDPACASVDAAGSQR